MMSTMNVPQASTPSSADEQSSHYSPNAGATNSSNSTPPLTLHELDHWQHHIALQEFGQDLQAAANAVFSRNTQFRYAKVSVLMLCWEDEDPNLPVSIEISKLDQVFDKIYGYDTEIWRIPDENPHHRLNLKVLDFVTPSSDSKEHLKIVYYAGHGKLSRERTLLWTSWRNNMKDKCPTVKWSGIQNVLEEADSDVLILLDCCASGVSTTNIGNKSNELIAACAFNSRANGVGPYSFTDALVIELRALAKKVHFTTAELYSNIFCRVQNRMPEGESERHPAPVHIVLTHERPSLKSIQLSILKRPPRQEAFELSAQQWTMSEERQQRSILDASNPQVSTSSNPRSPFQPPSLGISEYTKFPKMAFSIRLKETVNPQTLSTDLFMDWLRDIPTSVDRVQVEACFGSFSSLLIVSVPVSMAGYLSTHPAVFCLGPITSSNFLQYPKRYFTATEVPNSTFVDSKNHAVGADFGIPTKGKDNRLLNVMSLPDMLENDFEMSNTGYEPSFLNGIRLPPFPDISRHEMPEYDLDMLKGPRLSSSIHYTLPTPPDSVRNSVTSQLPSYQSREANLSQEKRRLRRESHNLIERRRRDNINERIKELADLIPSHRLRDRLNKKERESQSASTNSELALSSSEIKEPSKGDILDGSVTWMRDIMSLLYHKLDQCDDLERAIAMYNISIGSQSSEGEVWLRSELNATIIKNRLAEFHYSRELGSGLHVPGYTSEHGHLIQFRDSTFGE